MGFPDNIPTCQMSPLRVSSETDAIELRPQFPPFPMNNEPFDQHSLMDHPPSFKRARISENNNSSRMTQPPQQNKGTSHLFFKTRMCAKFRAGTCRNGEGCNFAHGFDDIRQPPPNWQELVGMRNEEQRLPAGNWDEDQKIIHKMKLCKKFCNGEECPYGEKCSFLHDDPAKYREDSGGKIRESSAISIGTTNVSPKSYRGGSYDSDGNGAMNNVLVMSRVKSAYWKTKLCNKWETTGQCNFGEDCHFAHGQAELQVPGGRIEAEIATVISNSAKAIIPTLPKALPVSVTETPTTYAASLPLPLPLPKEEERDKKHLCRWNGTKKINQIYGDWIDDTPLSHNLTSEVET